MAEVLDRAQRFAIYLDMAKLLEKSEETQIDQAALDAILRDSEGTTAAALLDIIKKARAKFLRRFKPDADLTEAQLEDLIRGAVEASFPTTLTQTLVVALAPIVAATLKQNIATFNLDVDFEQANTAALDYLTTTTENYFTTLGDSQVKSILASIAEGKSQAHTLDDIVAEVRATYGKDLVYDTAQGPRTVDNATWAAQVARTEGTRAAAASTRSLLHGVGALTWRWVAEASACDECAQNDDEIVAIDDDFPSGDSEPPAHPNCRCIVSPVVAELTGEQDDNQSDEADG